MGVVILILLMTACEHKVLYYAIPQYRSLRVTFDWSRIVNHEKPEGMRVVFFPKNSAKICRIAKNERFTSVSPQ